MPPKQSTSSSRKGSSKGSSKSSSGSGAGAGATTSPSPSPSSCCGHTRAELRALGVQPVCSVKNQATGNQPCGHAFDAHSSVPQSSSLRKDFEVILSRTHEHHRPVRGFLAMTCFIAFWIVSLGAPIIWWYLWTSEWRWTLAILIALAVYSYVPGVPHWPGFLSAFFNGFSSYFPATSIISEVPLKQIESRPNILCVHSHGIFCMGWSCLFSTIQSHTYCFAKALFISPYFRLMTRLTGKPSSVDKQTFLSLLQRKAHIAVIPGGFQEASIHSSSEDRVYLSGRQGFVKYALQYGYTLTPTFVFNERKTYTAIEGLTAYRLWLNKWNIPTVVVWGVWWAPLLPHPVPIHIVVGTPLLIPHIEQPSKEDVDFYHAVYTEHLVALYERHKTTYYGQDFAGQLKIF